MKRAFRGSDNDGSDSVVWLEGSGEPGRIRGHGIHCVAPGFGDAADERRSTTFTQQSPCLANTNQRPRYSETTCLLDASGTGGGTVCEVNDGWQLGGNRTRRLLGRGCATGSTDVLRTFEWRQMFKPLCLFIPSCSPSSLRPLRTVLLYFAHSRLSPHFFFPLASSLTHFANSRALLWFSLVSASKYISSFLCTMCVSMRLAELAGIFLIAWEVKMVDGCALSFVMSSRT
ncbi:hypothetical protein VTK56DRAFT_3954 [Thermocarpiscus australiensis]